MILVNKTSITKGNGSNENHCSFYIINLIARYINSFHIHVPIPSFLEVYEFKVAIKHQEM